MTGRLYSSCVRSSMLHGSETWPVRKENEVALQRAEMRMVRWMSGVKLTDFQVRSWEREIRYRCIGITAEQVAMVWACAAKRIWFGEEMHGVWSRGSKTKRKTVKHVNWIKGMLWIIVNGEVDKACPTMRMGMNGWMFLLVQAYPGSPGPKAIKWLCVCCALLYYLTMPSSIPFTFTVLQYLYKQLSNQAV